MAASVAWSRFWRARSSSSRASFSDQTGRCIHLNAAQRAFWAAPETLETAPAETPPLTHILSPFDPLVIQRVLNTAKTIAVVGVGA